MVQIQAIFLENNIAEIYFIMDRSDLHLTFAVYLEMPEIFTDLPTGSKIACVFLPFSTVLFTPCWEICKYLSHSQIHCKI